MPQYLAEFLSPQIEHLRDMAKYDSLLKAESEASLLYGNTLGNNTPQEQAEAMMILAYVKRHLRKYDEALLLYNQALPIWKSVHNNNKIAVCVVGMEIIRCHHGRNPNAIKNIIEVLDAPRILPSTMVHSFLAIGSVYSMASDYLSAYEYYDRALRLAKEQHLPEEYRWALTSIGEIHLYSGKMEYALRCLIESLHTPSGAKEYLLLHAYTTAVQSVVYTELRDWHHALAAADESYNYYQKAEMSGGKAMALARKALAYRGMGRYDDAYDCLMNAENDLNDANVLYLRKDFLLYLGWLFSMKEWKNHDFHRARQLLQQCVELCNSLGERPNKMRALGILATIHEQEGDYRSALEYQKQMHAVYAELEAERMRMQSDTNEIKSQLRLSQRERELLAEKNQELALLNTQLQQQAEQLAEQQEDIERYNLELMESNLALQRSYEQKSEVVAIVAHQLKSPLIEVKYLAQHALIINPNTEMAERLGEIDNRASQMLASIERFITLSSIGDRNSLRITQVQVDAVISDIMTMLRHNAQQKNIELLANLETNLSATTDEFALTQIVENLLSNAVKYSPHSATVYISASSIREDNVQTAISITIRDEGKGFSDSDKLHVFEKYRRLSAQPTNNESSSGLGLSIVKNFVMVLNGTITIESSEGKGAMFTVRIPCIA